jgi:hypothetical protein
VTVKNYLLNLTTRRAADLFFAALVLGIIFILSGFGLPWTPGIVVAAYGSVLLYAEKVCLVSNTEMTNNSPYFLGFLFFLVALASTFNSFSVQASDSQLQYIIRQLGSALFPTIVGLPFRQVLFAYSTSQADQDLFFRTLEDELRRSATEFRRSQAELVQLVQEFVEMRRGLFSEEEKASRRYVQNLEKAIALFDTSLSDYPIVISSTLSSCAQSLQGLKEKLRELSQAAEHTDPRQLSDIVAQFDSVKTSAGGLAGELSNLKSTVEHLRALAEGVPATINERLVSAGVDLDRVRSDLRGKIGSIQSDLTAIDKVLTDFVVVAQGRIEAIR